MYSYSPDVVAKDACSIFNVPIDDNSRLMLLVIERWDRLDTLAFDVIHAAHDPTTAHHVANLPVVLFDYGKQHSVVKAASPNFEKEVDVVIAREHNLNGWSARPPYVADHTGMKVPTYPDPRDLITAQLDPTMQ
ncbi:hypothetical protein K458DRAFT_7406 [Lentithecium fluviatile CBS 122367]|uniref:Uncharacterized protein n=1 Tax=Lentithecium fluviatile CBS 122367 TaxID=1168545 RepID=A0A6G1JNT1_9PLEO|nr:hypothetical protein K458DRAFT_7406 [Lentithecium fluviatile CBS 122367]